MPDDRTSRSSRPPAPRREDENRTPAPEPGRRAGKEAAIEAVSDLLALKKPALQKLATPVSARLPNFPGKTGASGRRLENGPSSRARFDAPEPMIPPQAVSLPDAARADEPGVGEGPSAESVPAGPPAGASSALAPAPGRGIKSSPIDAGRPTPQVATGGGGEFVDPGGTGRNVEAGPRPDHRLPAPTRSTPRGGGTADLPASGDPPRRVDEEAGANWGVPSDSVRVAGQVDPPALSGPAQFGDPGPIRGSRGEGVASEGSGQDPGAAWATIAPGVDRDVKAGPGTGTVGVRASLAIGPRDLAPPPSGPSGDPGGASMDFGGPWHGSFGPGQGGDAPGSPPSQAEGGTDLSKTNELLEQILEAVRARRDSALPAGGPSVYSGR